LQGTILNQFQRQVWSSYPGQPLQQTRKQAGSPVIIQPAHSAYEAAHTPPALGPLDAPEKMAAAAGRCGGQAWRARTGPAIGQPSQGGIFHACFGPGLKRGWPQGASP
jgi:hypothetical protein